MPASRRSRKYEASLGADGPKGSHACFGRRWTAACVLDQNPIGSSGLTFGGVHGGSSAYTSRRGALASNTLP